MSWKEEGEERKDTERDKGRKGERHEKRKR